MFLRTNNATRPTAAWRISLPTTIAFALGTALAFLLMYWMVATSMQQRSDAWLIGESEVLSEVAGDTPRDDLNNRMIEEVAELANREVADPHSTPAQNRDSVFVLEYRVGHEDSALWVGPGSRDAAIAAIRRLQLSPGVPAPIRLPGRHRPFRIVLQQENGTNLYLGYSDRVGTALMRRLTSGFLIVWGAMVLLGFILSFLGAYRTLQRVERITETAAGIGTEDLSSRLPEASPPDKDEITRLSQTFNRMLDRIQASVHQLRVLTDSVAHDLKSPVTSIRGVLEVALSGNQPNFNWREPVADAIEKLDHLSSMLNTTLDLAEANAGALQLRREPVDLRELVEQLVELYRPSLAERKHILHTDLEPATIAADPALVGRAISNLLDNELAHLPPGCEITVRLHQDNSHAQLQITDNGPGLPPEVKSRPFERFVKGPQSCGHGLGLAFVEAVLHAHNGAVSIEDRPGGGIILTLTVPATITAQKDNAVPLETA